MKPLLPAALPALLLLTALDARAQSHAGDVAAAQTLFDDARALIKSGKYAEACPKLEESERLDSGPGTEFNLADCYEHAGRTASAWAQFVAVADAMRAVGQREREKVARDRAKALEPRLARLTLNVSVATRAPGLEIKRDGEVVRQAQWGIAVAVDPGKHSLSAAAPGLQAWQQSVDVQGDGKTIAVDVPPLAPLQAAPAAPPPPQATPTAALAPLPAASESVTTPAAPEAAPSAGGGQRTVALVVGGLGIVGVGLGGYFGLQALSKHSDYVPHCPNNVCDPTGLQLHSDASSDATISTIATGAGLAAVAGGVVLWLTAPKATSASTGLKVVPTVTARAGGLSLQGAW